MKNNNALVIEGVLKRYFASIGGTHRAFKRKELAKWYLELLRVLTR